MLREELSRYAASQGSIAIEVDDKVVFFSNLARRWMVTAARDLIEPSTVQRELGAFLANAAEDPVRPTLEMHIVREPTELDAVLGAVRNLLEAFHRRCYIRLIVHSGSSEAAIEPVVSWLFKIRSCYKDERICEISIRGPFEQISEPAMQSLLNGGMSLRITHGWWPGCQIEDYHRIRTQLLQDLSSFGLRVVAEWYVHSGNIAALDRLVEQSLRANFYSGFSTPIQSQSPHATTCDTDPPAPDVGEYIELLVRLYERYPHYDHGFDPIRDIAEHWRDGGWDSCRNVPNRIRVIIGCNDQVRTYRELPAFSRQWTTSSELAVASSASIRNALLEFVHDNYRLDLNERCSGCHCRFICGGLDAPALHHESMRTNHELEVACEHRKVLIEAFAIKRFRAHAGNNKTSHDSAIRH